jgi:2-oxoglutarate ferredoxin oxidoreductase subunit delta
MAKFMTTTQIQRGYIVVLEERCKGCELCVPACPVDILAMSRRTNSKGWNVVDTQRMEKCIACNLCALICPDRAIDVYRFDQPLKVEIENNAVAELTNA